MWTYGVPLGQLFYLYQPIPNHIKHIKDVYVFLNLVERFRKYQYFMGTDIFVIFFRVTSTQPIGAEKNDALLVPTDKAAYCIK